MTAEWLGAATFEHVNEVGAVRWQPVVEGRDGCLRRCLPVYVGDHQWTLFVGKPPMLYRSRRRALWIARRKLRRLRRGTWTEAR